MSVTDVIRWEFRKLVASRGRVIFGVGITTFALLVGLASDALGDGDEWIDTYSLVFAELGAIIAAFSGGTAGGQDLHDGQFRYLALTGRSRAALVAVRVPAAILATWALLLPAFAVVVGLGLAAGDSGQGGDLVPQIVYPLVTSAVVTGLAVGLGSLFGNGTPAAAVTLALWFLVLPAALIIDDEGFAVGEDRSVVAVVSDLRTATATAVGGTESAVCDPDYESCDELGTATAVLVLVGWVGLAVGAGIARVRTRDL